MLGASAALADHLRRHPEQWRELTDPTLGTTRPPAYAVREACCAPWAPTRERPTPVAELPDAEAVDALRVEYRRLLLRLASRDLAHHSASTTRPPSSPTWPPAPSRPRWPWPAPGSATATPRRCRLAVIAMGKCGGHELNYVSDVDVIFVAEPAEGRGRDAGAAGRHPAGLAP